MDKSRRISDSGSVDRKRRDRGNFQKGLNMIDDDDAYEYEQHSRITVAMHLVALSNSVILSGVEPLDLVEALQELGVGETTLYGIAIACKAVFLSIPEDQAVEVCRVVDQMGAGE